MTEDGMVGWHYRFNGHEFEQALGIGDRQESLVCYSPRGRKESDTTEHAYTTLPAAGTLEGIPEVSTTCPAPFYAGIPSGTLWHSWLALFFFAFLSGNLCSWKVVE